MRTFPRHAQELVAGFLGDYGIGSEMAKSDADKALRSRIAGIRAAQRTKQRPTDSASLWDGGAAFVGGVVSLG